MIKDRFPVRLDLESDLIVYIYIYELVYTL